MFCQYCGGNNANPQAKFCLNCGKPLTPTPATVPQNAPSAAPASNAPASAAVGSGKDMTFWQAVKTVYIDKCFDFKGRARRKEFWYAAGFDLLLFIAAIGLITLTIWLFDSTFYSTGGDNFDGFTSIVNLIGIIYLVLSFPMLPASVRRMHDMGKPGWLPVVVTVAYILLCLLEWGLFGFVGFIGSLVTLVFCAQDSQPGDNSYGPDPKA